MQSKIFAMPVALQRGRNQGPSGKLEAGTTRVCL